MVTRGGRDPGTIAESEVKVDGGERCDQVALQRFLCKEAIVESRCDRGGGSAGMEPNMTKGGDFYSFLVFLNRVIIRGWRKMGLVV